MIALGGRRSICVAAALTMAIGAGCGTGTSGKKASPSSTSPTAKPATPTTASVAGPVTTSNTAPLVGCQPVPPPGPDFSWLPKDLPMPPGTYAVQEQTAASGAKSGTMVVPLGVTDFVRFALAHYRDAGWQLGRGDAERGEAEDSFAKGQQGGAWRVRETFCDLSKSELLITFVNNVAATPAPSLSPSTTSAPPTTQR